MSLNHFGIPTAGDMVAQKYRIEEELGRGSAGIVYRATHAVTGKQFAVKWLFPSLAANRVAAERFLRESKVACRIDHPNVVQIHDAGEDGDSLFMVMELLRGEPLTSFLARGPHDPALIVRTLLPAIRGVGAAHAAGVIHRDLKPDNIFLSTTRGGDAEAKVVDFGISKIANRETKSQSLTAAGSVVGTPYYMAPEQITNSQGVDARADVYSLGVILYQGLTGDLPYDSDGLHDLFIKIVQGGAPNVRTRNPQVSAGLDAVVARTMSVDPNARFQTIDELVSALAPFSGEAPRARVSLAPSARKSDRAPAPLATSARAKPMATAVGVGARASTSPAAVAPATARRDPTGEGARTAKTSLTGASSRPASSSVIPPPPNFRPSQVPPAPRSATGSSAAAVSPPIDPNDMPQEGTPTEFDPPTTRRDRAVNHDPAMPAFDPLAGSTDTARGFGSPEAAVRTGPREAAAQRSSPSAPTVAAVAPAGSESPSARPPGTQGSAPNPIPRPPSTVPDQSGSERPPTGKHLHPPLASLVEHRAALSTRVLEQEVRRAKPGSRILMGLLAIAGGALLFAIGVGLYLLVARLL